MYLCGEEGMEVRVYLCGEGGMEVRGVPVWGGRGGGEGCTCVGRKGWT